MGEAARRRAAGARISWCRGCTQCCTLLEITSLDKPMYLPCPHIADHGCGIYGQPERPPACSAYECAYLTARRTNAPDRHSIPHPLDAGAFFHRDPLEKVFVVFVDPERPELWKRSGIVDYLRRFVGKGYDLLILDRGRRMVITTAQLLEEILKMDYVALADAEGRPRDISSYEPG